MNDNPTQGTLADGPVIVNIPHENPLSIGELFKTYMQYKINLTGNDWKTLGVVEWGWQANISRYTNSIVTSGHLTEGIGVVSEIYPIMSPDIHDVVPVPVE